MKDTILKPIVRFLSSRLFMLFLLVAGLFYTLGLKLFDLQIVKGEEHLEKLSANIAADISIDAQRGNIYDRYGRPLAVNHSVYSVSIDPSMSIDYVERNKVILDLMRLLEKNGEEYIDDFPMSQTEPYEFVFPNDESKAKQYRWLKDMGLAKETVDAELISPTMAFNLLREKFGVDENLSNADARKIISIRQRIYLVRYYSYNPIAIANDVGMDTVTKIEEDSEKYKGINVNKNAMRYYPEGEYMAHLVGYVGSINSDELSAMVKDKGYKPTDTIGKTGAELAFEDTLRGQDGKLTVIVDTNGRRVSEIEGSRVEPKQGGKVFMTIDAAFQKECYLLTVGMLKEVLLGRLTSNDPKVWPLTAKDVLSSLVASNNISPKEIFESEQGTYSYIVKQYVQNAEPEASVATNSERLEVNKIIAAGIDDDSISLSTILMVLIEQGIITADEYYKERIENGWVSATQVLIDKITEDEISPAMTGVDPCTGSLVVVDVKSGDVLAAVSYPSYDTNEYMNNTNTVFPKLNNNPASPMINRAFSEKRPPGSTFKMVSAATGLETGIITENTHFHDEVVFTKAGTPEPSCWNKSGHGTINVVQALEGSCNYFFFETLYRLGNSKSNSKMNSISALNKYMSLFGLDEPTGVEIGEANKARGKSPLNMSSPELKELIYSDSLTETSEWVDGNTIHTAMGQGFNDFTPAVMARYISIIANRGTKYNFHLLNRIVTENEVLEYVPSLSVIGSEISENTWDIIHVGMRRVITGTTGTARSIFDGFPLDVAGKTGTAEQIKSRPEHTSFGGFVPYNDPEIAVYVMIPFSDTKATASPATILARRVMEAYYKFDIVSETAVPVNAIVQ